jgi:hypothetical protein
MTSAFIRLCVVALVAFAPLAWSQSPAIALGEDSVPLNLQVPVRISGFAGTQAMVWCEARNSAGVAVSANARVFAVSGGGSEAVVPVTVQVTRNYAANIRGWRCVLSTADRPITGRLAAIPREVLPLAEVSGAL